MADDIKLVFGVEQGGLLKAIKNTKTLQGNVKLLSSSLSKTEVSYYKYNKAVGDLAKATNTSKKELLAHGKALRADEKATKKAAAETKRLADEKKKAAAETKRLASEEKKAAASTALAAKEEERLKNKFVAGHTAMNIYTKGLNELAVARKRGIITTLEQTAAVSRLNAQMKAGTGVFAKHSVSMGQSARRTNQLGVMMQQTGYQVGDFAVQVGSGQNVLVAFGQQATQLVGTMAMFAKTTKLIALFSGLGILIPVISGIGAAFMRTKKAADKTASSLKKAKSQFESIIKSIRDFSLAKEAAHAGVSLDELFLTRQNGGITKAKGRITELTEELVALREEAEEGFKDIGLTAQTPLQEGSEGNIFSNVGKNLQPLSPSQVARQRFQAAANRNSNDQSTKVDHGLQVALSIQNQIKKNQEDRLKKTREIGAEEAKLLPLKQLQAKFAEEDLLNTNESKRATEQKVRLLQTEIKHGADSVAIDKLKKEFAVQEFAKEVSLLNISDKRKMVLIEQFKIRQAGEVELNKLATQNEETYTRLLAQNEVFVNSLNEASDEARKKAEKQVKLVAQLKEKYGEALVTALALAGVDVSASMSAFIDKALKAQSDLEGLGETYGTQLAKVNAQIKALEEGKVGEVAAFVAGERAKITALYETSKVLATQANDIVALAEASLAFLAAMGELDALAAAKTKLAGMKPTGGGGNVIDINEIIEARKLQIQQDRVLIGLSGEQHEAQRIYYELLKENEKADVQLTETELNNSAKKIAAKLEENRILEEATAQQKDLAQGIANSMGDAFTSIVDGTKSVKDAFKDMARSIIKQLFEVLVVQQLVGSVGVGNKGGSGLAGLLSGTLQADGGAWQGGSQIQAYANGGVVGSPTTFPMAGGKTGLMGEAGPEAIMPLKRGANGKLGVQMEGGGGDNVVIHQNFNFQANGDESVKKLIAQAAPQIANMTKSSMLNDRRRGGATKAVFG